MKNTNKGILTLLFYAVAFISIYILNEVSPSGPCTPGAGILLVILLPALSIVLLIYNINKTLKGNKMNKTPALIHFIALLLMAIFIKFS